MSETPHLQNHHLQWGAETLWQRLEPLLPGLSVEVVARTDSTNTQLLERARRAGAHDEDDNSRLHGRRAGDAQPCLLVAEAQTRGRGRQGKPWYSSPGASLTFSLSLPFSPADWSGLSLAVGVAVAEALVEFLQRTRRFHTARTLVNRWIDEEPGRPEYRRWLQRVIDSESASRTRAR